MAALGGLALLLLVTVAVVSSIAYSRTRTALNKAEAKTRWARKAVDEMYTQVAEKWLADTPHMTEVQRQFLIQAMAFYQELSEEESTDPEVRAETGLALRRLGEIETQVYQAASAEQPVRKAIAVFEKLVTEFPDQPGYQLELARSYEDLGDLLKNWDRRQEAEEWLRKSCALSGRLVEAFPDDPSIQEAHGWALRNLGDLLQDMQRYDEAVELLQQAVGQYRQLVARFPDVSDYQMDLGNALRPYGEALRRAGRLEAAAQVVHDAVALFEKLVARSPASPHFRENQAGNYAILAVVQIDLGRLAEAEKALERSIQLREQELKDYPAHLRELGLFWNYTTYGALLLYDGRFADAERALRSAREYLQKAAAKTPSHPRWTEEAALLYSLLANLYITDAAKRQDIRQALALIQEALKRQPENTTHLTLLGGVYYRLNQSDRAATTLRHVIDKDGPMGQPLRSWTSNCVSLKRIAELSCAMSLVQRWFFLAMCYQRQGDFAKARESYQQGLACRRAQGSALAISVKELDALQAEAAALIGVGGEARPKAK